MIATLRDAKMHLDVAGMPALKKFIKSKLSGKAELLKVKDDSIQYPFWLRIPSSDTYTYQAIIRNHDYRFNIKTAPKVIVDAGANIGLASVYFANQYPDAKIIAIEPEADNFQLLLKNVAPYPNIIPVQAALWHQAGKVNLGVGCGSQDSFMTEEISGANANGNAPSESGVLGEVDALTVDSIMATYNLDKIDILKIDIEGAEKEVFGSTQAWLNNVDSLVVELHEHMKGGCNRSFYNGSNGFSHEWLSGENVCLSRGNFILPAV
jgi:FkbM family methyltransferase